MANPAPTINQINAFNATQGTTIDFNIIGGTELVRSNRIYIYDLSDNSLICTHLYVSTESIHELPANTDGSILYADGKSSADFVNGAQYYAQIQTFTDIAGTEGGSGLSVAKMFWCLVDPTLTITTIPSTISTTSYNVSATYNANTSVVSNIIQQYQFSLYSATGSLLQSSGVVVGSGEQQGTSTAYDISYNFTGLSVGSSYYVTIEVTTTQGMSVTTQSNAFTVSIDTPTLGEATVVNNACDGYISVTSNLSSEYGGSGSGEIVSFETDSENVFTKLQVDLDPIQDLHGYDSPWVGGAGKNKCPLFTTTTVAGVTFTVNSDGTVTANGTATGRDATVGVSIDTSKVYGDLLFNGAYGGSSSTYNAFCYDTTARARAKKWNGTTSSENGYQNLTEVKIVQDNNVVLSIRVQEGQTVNNIKFYPMLCSGTTTDATYAPYENICPISGHDEVGVSVVGKNLFNGNLANGYYDVSNNGAFVSNANWRATDKIKCKASTAYTMSGSSYSTGGYNGRACFWDKNDVYLGDITPSTTFTSLPNSAYMAIYLGRSYVTDTMQIEENSSATTYEPYNGTTYTTTLPSTTYGGTLDVVSGLLTVDRAIITYNGTEWWGVETQQGSASFYRQRPTDMASTLQQGDAICNACPVNITTWQVGVLRITSGYMNFVLGNALGISTSAEWQTWLSSNPVTVVYPLATPQTYQLTPQQIQTLVGVNNVWSEQGDIELSYHIPITNLLVKRQDVDDVSGDWLTLYSQPITQASDMDFTFIDFTNQYGKTYKYALVPLLTQTQSGVEVEVEGGYTVSDEVQSVFDGVFIADSTGSQKCKANVGYGNVDMNQTVGTITPIGAKHPIVITNSKNQYHNGSISGTIVPDDYYFNGNLSRIDMVNKRNELEQFLTNKRVKIIKDWNGNIWLVMIMDNVSCTFNNNYGMGIVNFSTNWVEVGDPTNQQDLQETGLIDVGGV